MLNKFIKNGVYLFAILLFFIFIFPKNALAECCGNIPTEKEGVYTCREINENDCKGFIVSTYSSTLVCNMGTGRCMCPDKTLCFQVPFPGAKAIEQTAVNNTEGLLGKYIFAMYQFLIWIAISLAIFMIMLAGFIWLISAGNQGLIGKAKGYINNALYGLIVVLASYLILISINPRLVENTMPTIPKPPAVATAVGGQCCINPKTSDRREGIKLLEGQTCQDTFSILGGDWMPCDEHDSAIASALGMKDCCICEEAGVLWGYNTVCFKNPPSEKACIQNGNADGFDGCYYNLAIECAKKNICVESP